MLGLQRRAAVEHRQHDVCHESGGCGGCLMPSLSHARINDNERKWKRNDLVLSGVFGRRRKGTEDEGREGRRDGGTEGRREEEKESLKFFLNSPYWRYFLTSVSRLLSSPLNIDNARARDAICSCPSSRTYRASSRACSCTLEGVLQTFVL